MSIRLSGINSLAYMGVEPISPPALVIHATSPTSSDWRNFNLGTIWLNRTNQSIWFLVSLAENIATWVQLSSSGGPALQFDTNAGIVMPVAGIVNVLGGTNINTAGSGNTITVNLNETLSFTSLTTTGSVTVGGGLTVDSGGATITGTVTLPGLGAGVVQSSSSGIISSSNGTNGQVLIGGGTAPEWANITSTGATVTITNGPNSINLEATGTAGVTSLAGNTGTATPLAGVINVIGGTNITTTGVSHTLTINLSGTPTFTSITTGSVTTTGNLTVGGSLTISGLGAGVVQSNSSGVISSSNGTNGQVLIGGGAAPVWANLTSTGATVTITNGPNTINLETAGGGGGPVNEVIMPFTNQALTQGVIYIGNTSVPNYPVFQVYDSAGNQAPTPSSYYKGGSASVFVGANAGTTLSSSFSSSNTAVGSSALGSINGTGTFTAGANNTAIGYLALPALTTGSTNCAFGWEAGAGVSTVPTGLTTGNNNVFIGPRAGYGCSGSESTNIIIGSTTGAGLNNTIDIGSTPFSGTPYTSCKIGGIYGSSVSGTSAPVYINSSGILGTVVPSSFEIKRDIKPIGNESSAIYELRPVSYIYKDDTTNTKQYGLIAEEVDEIMPYLADYKDGKAIGVKYHHLPILLLNELQKLHAQVQELEGILNEWGSL